MPDTSRVGQFQGFCWADRLGFLSLTIALLGPDEDCDERKRSHKWQHRQVPVMTNATLMNEPHDDAGFNTRLSKEF